jgi:Tol biopolymer transport system component
MALLNKNFRLLFLISFIFYSCSSLPAHSTLPAIETEKAITTASPPLPQSENVRKEIFLIKDMDSGNYYITGPSGTDRIQVDIPANTRGLSMSPNGRMIAYISSENSILYLLDIEKKITQALVDSIVFQPGTGLAWSPDSQNIVFSCRVQGTSGLSLCLTGMINKENIQTLVKSKTLSATGLLDGAISPSWSGDGQKIVFLSSTMPPSLSGVKTVAEKDIWLFDFSTNNIKLILQNDPEGISSIFQPVYLSENNSILFSGQQQNFNTIFDYSIDSHQTQNIIPADGGFDLINFVLSPDGKSFLVHIPTMKNSAQNFVPTLYSIDGQLPRQLNSLADLQIISWVSQ